MKLLSYVILIVMLLSLGAPLVGAQEVADPWGDPVAAGIEYREYHLPDPNNVFVARLERNVLSATIESSIARGKLSGGTQTVAGMSQHYDGAINYWENSWGKTNEVAVAINGYYFNYGTGIPYQGQVHSGWYSKLFDLCESGTGGSGFAWKLNREVFIGESVRTPVTDVVYLRTGEDPVQVFDGINIERNSDQLILYTPQYNNDTGTEKDGSVEVLVRMTSPTLINPNVNEMPQGVIERIFPGKGSTPIPFGHIVLSFNGSKKDEFLNLNPQPKKDDVIGIRQRIRGCLGDPDYPWENTYASIGGAFYFLKDGQINDFADKGEANVRNPRTAIAYNNDFIYFIVVDGRDEMFSKGMTIREIAEFAKYELGATHGIAEDGGGSSTMVVDGEVKNNTFCNIVICKSHLFLPTITNSNSNLQSVQSAPFQNTYDLPLNSATEPLEQLSGDGIPLTEEFYTYSPDATGDILQRLVANGMMMVVVKPQDISTDFTEGDRIITISPVNVRLGPGTNYGVIETVEANITGIVYGKDNGLNGIWAKDYYWWHVLLEIGERDVIGWVKKPTITKVVY